MTDIITLKGDPYVAPASAPPSDIQAEVIARLEELLAQAKSGEISGVAFATSMTRGGYRTGWSGGSGSKFTLSAAVNMLAFRYNDTLLRDQT